ncbi:MAG: 30S ribosomal protein S16 [Alphaproteobacteria bacterium]
MAVKIRLSRGGSKKRPFYRVVVADVRAPRDGKYIERVGSYNPMLPKDSAERFVVEAERVKYWLSTGAEPTERVESLLAKIGLVEKKAFVESPKKSQPKAKAQERLKEQAEKEARRLEAETQAKADAEVAAAAPAEETPAEETAEA